MSTDDKKEYLISLCPEVKELCKPLFDHLYISFFRFVRSYPDHSKFVLCSNEALLKAYFAENFDVIEHANYYKIPDDTKGISLHGQCTHNNPICNFWNKYADRQNFNFLFSMYRKNKLFLEHVNFGVQMDSHAVDNIFLNNNFLLKHFLIYFYDKGRDLLIRAKDHRFEVAKDPNFNPDHSWHLGLSLDKQYEFLNSFTVERLFLDDTIESDFLNNNEVKVLKLLVCGDTTSDIATRFKISEAHVEKYLQSISKKIGVNSINDLLLAALSPPLSEKLSSFFFKTKI